MQVFLIIIKSTLSYLAISEHGGIIALEAALDELVYAGLVDALLLRVDVEHKVIGEGLVLSQEDLRFARCDQRAHMAALDLLLGHLRTNPENKRREMVGDGIKRLFHHESRM